MQLACDGDPSLLMGSLLATAAQHHTFLLYESVYHKLCVAAGSLGKVALTIVVLHGQAAIEEAAFKQQKHEEKAARHSRESQKRPFEAAPSPAIFAPPPWHPQPRIPAPFHAVTLRLEGTTGATAADLATSLFIQGEMHSATQPQLPATRLTATRPPLRGVSQSAESAVETLLLSNRRSFRAPRPTLGG